ncbi:MAG: hypothetical protein OXI22_23300 [Defluviicoccus sp.]|nr:hypothetical protein [Defluviicoccus sp.]MDE0386827.1 hypothetical protein [Defluviicoccus sp.]
MSSYRGIAAASFAAMAISCAAQSAMADESGSFTALASLIADYTMIEHPGGTIVGGASAGTNTVLESSGGPFPAGEHSHVNCVVYGKRSAAGLELEAPCLSTTAAGDKLYSISKRSAGGVEEGAGGAGRLELLSGTGKFAGVTGTCTYRTAYLAEGRVVTMSDCSWQRSAGQ